MDLCNPPDSTQPPSAGATGVSTDHLNEIHFVFLFYMHIMAPALKFTTLAKVAFLKIIFRIII